MKKQLLILAGALCLSLGAQAQTSYSQSFTGTTVPTGWGAPIADYTLTANNTLSVTMLDSIGPQQNGSSPVSHYANFYYLFTTPVNMASGCKCITFDIDNTGNPAMTLFVQVQDNTQNTGSITNKYVDDVFASVAAGYSGPITVTYNNDFFNHYAGGNKIDSTHIGGIQFQPVGPTLGAAPWFKKFKGNFTIDNVVVAGTPAAAPLVDVKNGVTAVNSGGTVALASVASGSTGTPQVLTIENTGTSDLTISSITKSGTNAAEFTLGTHPNTIAAGTTATFSVTFAPTSVGTGKTATVTIANNDATNSSYTLILTANATAAVTAVSAAQANISSSKLYPNPTSDMVNVEMELKSSSEVKVVLSDLLGKEVMTIATGTMSSLNESFSVTNLNKGIYTVNYFINGSAAKAELLMVK